MIREPINVICGQSKQEPNWYLRFRPPIRKLSLCVCPYSTTESSAKIAMKIQCKKGSAFNVFSSRSKCRTWYCRRWGTGCTWRSDTHSIFVTTGQSAKNNALNSNVATVGAFIGRLLLCYVPHCCWKDGCLGHQWAGPSTTCGWPRYVHS